MRQRTVSDLMTHDVIDVGPSATFKDIVKLLAEHDITAVPVVDDSNHPLGVVSEADLMRCEARQPEPSGRLPHVLQRYAPPGGGEADRSEPTGEPLTARTLMTSPAVVARPEWSVVEAARFMEDRKVKRLPVVDRTSRLIGMLSRADLLRVFLRQDRAIREEITGDILTGTFRISPTDVAVHVVDGYVTLKGVVERTSTVPVLTRLCRSVDGVVSVSPELDARIDDMGGDTDTAHSAAGET